MSSTNVLWALVLCGAIVVTNRYEGPPVEQPFVPPDDAFAFLIIARASPRLPVRTVGFQHAQRVAIPYVVGTIGRLIPIPLHRIFTAGVVLLELATLVLVAGLLNHLALGRRQSVWILAMLAWNPWTFRASLTYPEMITDAGFVLGLTLMLRGLIVGGTGSVLGGQLVASLSRQTGLLLVPMACVWLWHGRGVWAPVALSRRRALSVAVIAIAGGVYVITGWIASMFSGPSDNVAHLYGLATWLAAAFDGRALAVFLARMIVAPAIPLLFLAALPRRALERGSGAEVTPLLWLGILCVAAQPLFAGPDVTGGNGPRLVALALMPLSVVLAIRIRDSHVFAHTPRARQYWAMGLLGLASVHHLYVLSGSSSDRTLFGAAYVLACAGLFAIARVESRDAAATIS